MEGETEFFQGKYGESASLVQGPLFVLNYLVVVDINSQPLESGCTDSHILFEI